MKNYGLPAKTSASWVNKAKVTAGVIERRASGHHASRCVRSYVLPVYTRTNSESKARVTVRDIARCAAASIP